MAPSLAPSRARPAPRAQTKAAAGEKLTGGHGGAGQAGVTGCCHGAFCWPRASSPAAAPGPWQSAGDARCGAAAAAARAALPAQPDPALRPGWEGGQGPGPAAPAVAPGRRGYLAAALLAAPRRAASSSRAARRQSEPPPPPGPPGAHKGSGAAVRAGCQPPRGGLEPAARRGKAAGAGAGAVSVPVPVPVPSRGRAGVPPSCPRGLGVTPVERPGDCGAEPGMLCSATTPPPRNAHLSLLPSVCPDLCSPSRLAFPSTTPPPPQKKSFLSFTSLLRSPCAAARGPSPSLALCAVTPRNPAWFREFPGLISPGSGQGYLKWHHQMVLLNPFHRSLSLFLSFLFFVPSLPRACLFCRKPSTFWLSESAKAESAAEMERNRHLGQVLWVRREDNALSLELRKH